MPVMHSNNASLVPYADSDKEDGRAMPPDPLVGLSNLGNTCYLNSSLQCLLHTRPFVAALLAGRHRADVNVRNPLGTGGELVGAFEALVKQIWSNESQSVAPRRFKQVLSKHRSQFYGYQQQDAQEAAIAVLDCLHEDLNRIREKPPVENYEANEDDSDSHTARECSKRFSQRHDSLVKELFMGQGKSAVECDKCRRTVVTFEPFMFLSLPIADAGVKFYLDVVLSFSPFRMAPTVHMTLPINYAARQRDVRDAMWATMRSVYAKTGEDWDGSVAAENVRRVLKAARFRDLVSRFGEDPPLVCFQLDSNHTSFKTVAEDHQFKPEDTHTRRKLYYFLFENREQGEMVTSRKSLKDKWLLLGAVASEASRYSSLPPIMLSVSGTMPLVALGEVVDGKVTSVLGERKLPPFEAYTWKRPGIPFALPWLTSRSQAQFARQTSVDDIMDGLASSTAQSDANSDEGRLDDGTLCDLFKTVKSRHDATPNLLTAYLSDCNFNWPQVYLPSVEWHRSKKPKYHPVSLEDCIEEFLKREKLDENNMWYCSHCREHRPAVKSLGLWKLPKIMLLHIKRFKQTEHGVLGWVSRHSRLCSRLARAKNDLPLKIPTDRTLDMRPYMLRQRSEGRYRLYGVVRHAGSLFGGHYTADVRCLEHGEHDEGQWYNFNDSQVTRVDLTAMEASKSAYLLFFERL